jgi:hypothetical protein
LLSAAVNDIIQPSTCLLLRCTDTLCKMNATWFQTLYHAQIKLSEYLGKDIGATDELFRDVSLRDS